MLFILRPKGMSICEQARTPAALQVVAKVPWYHRFVRYCMDETKDGANAAIAAAGDLS
jgi:hypothetical protein